jgi:signal recognition particle subunit SRP19
MVDLLTPISRPVSAELTFLISYSGLKSYGLSEKQLLEAITFQIHHLKPENIPKKPFNFTPLGTSTATATSAAPSSTSAAAKTSTKGKQPAAASKTTSSVPASSAPGTPANQAAKQRLPVPPEPLPPVQSRLSPYSPAVPTGILVDAVKAGMNAQQDGPIPGLPGAGGAGMQKGKRKVVRVRG